MKQWNRIWEEVASRACGGILLSRLLGAFDKIRFLLTHGFLASLFTSYTKEERLLSFGYLATLPQEMMPPEDAISAWKRRISELFENSRVVAWLERMGRVMLCRKTVVFGSFLLALGLGELLVCLLQTLGEGADINENILYAGGAILLSIPMLFCRQTWAKVLAEGRVLSPVLFRYFGFSRATLLSHREEAGSTVVMAAIGGTLGILTRFWDPKVYVAGFVLFVFLSVVFRVPEIGVLLLTGAVPFSHLFSRASLFLSLLVISVSFAYLVKWIRGKRVFRLHLFDGAVAVMGVLYLLGGVVTTGGIGSLYAACMYAVLLSGYFLAVNLLRSKEWIGRVWRTFLWSGTVSAIFALVELVTGKVNASWVDLSLFSNMGVRITGGFGNPNVYAEYLLLLLPFAYLFLGKQTEKWRGIAAGILLILLVNMIFTWSRGAWLGTLVSVCFFLLICVRAAPLLLIGGLMLLPTVSLFLPAAVLSRFTSIGNLADSSVSYRLSVWRGTADMLAATKYAGVGVGHSAFSAVYPAYAYGGSALVQHTHSVYLQILAELGIVGLLVFGAILVLFVQMCLEHMLRGGEKMLVASGLASVLGLLIMGLTDHIWYDLGIFFSFWLIVGITVSYIRVCRADEEKREMYHIDTRTQAKLDIPSDPFE